jgi:hypothetical protein
MKMKNIVTMEERKVIAIERIAGALESANLDDLSEIGHELYKLNEILRSMRGPQGNGHLNVSKVP